MLLPIMPAMTVAQASVRIVKLKYVTSRFADVCPPASYNWAHDR
jgi:hypothetical protein